MLWNLLYAPLLSGAMAFGPENELKQDNPYPPVSFAEIESIPDPVGMEIVQKALPGAYRHSVGSANTDIFDTALDVQCLGKQRAIVLESGGKKSLIYFSKIRQMVPTRYTPPGGASATSLLLFNYQNNFKERYQFIVEEKQEGDLNLLADIFTEFIRRESKGIPCEQEEEHSQPDPATPRTEPVSLPPEFTVRLSEIKNLCSGEVTEIAGKKVDYLGAIDFPECADEPAEEEISRLYDLVKEKYTSSSRAFLAICGNATRPTAQRCDPSSPDFGNEALAYRRAKNSALELEEMLRDKYNFIIVPYGNGTLWNRRAADIYFILEKK